MFDESPYYARRAFGSQGEFPPAAIFEYIHFLLDHVRGFAERALEEVHRLKGGGADLMVTKFFKQRARGRFHTLELGGVVGKDEVLAQWEAFLFAGATNRNKVPKCLHRRRERFRFHKQRRVDIA